jgi:hypothetical protein
MSFVLLAIVVAGFGRTFFLRPLFRVPPLHWYLYLHGAVQTGWVALFVAQASLIANRRVQTHRQLGAAGAILALCLIVLGTLTVLGLPPHFKEGHLSNDTAFDFRSITFVFWQDLADLLTFSILVGFGLLVVRHNPDAHKRLMLLATIRITGAALVRVAALLGAWIEPLAPQQAQVLFTSITIAGVLPLTLIVYDLRSMRRVHPATAVGVALNILTGAGAGAIAASAFGQGVFAALE